MSESPASPASPASPSKTRARAEAAVPSKTRARAEAAVPSKTRARAEAAVATLYVFGLGLWASGLLIAGAIVAPVVFRHVPAPTSGDAMALVFRRIDRLSLGIAVVLVASEAVLAVLRRHLLRQDLVRMVMLACMVGGALTLALYFTPSIQALHETGVIRDASPGGLRMESLHHGASRIGSCICILALVSGFAQVARTRSRESS